MIEQVKAICKAYNINPLRSKGQNFLVSQTVLTEIVAAAAVKKTDTILEVGPGLGILTEALVANAKRVVSVELDKQLFSFLSVKFAGIKNLELLNADILRFNPTEHHLTSYMVVANLPYNITSHFLKYFLTLTAKPTRLVLMLQREVAERICAKPGQLSLLGLSVQLYGQPKLISVVGRENFWPQPAVDSAIIAIDNVRSARQIAPVLTPVTEKEFWQLLRVGFSAKRKTLANNLAAGLKMPRPAVVDALIDAHLNEKIRAQNLGLDDWLTLAKNLKKYRN